MAEWFYHVTCFAKVSLLLLKSCNIKVINNIQIYDEEVSTHQVRFYHSCLVEMIVESANLVQMSKQKIFISMMENNQILIKKYISKHRAKSFILQETIVTKIHSLKTCARLLFMLSKDFLASARLHRVQKKFFLPKNAVYYLYRVKSNTIIGQRENHQYKKHFYT